jgi:hypothetical protein
MAYKLIWSPSAIFDIKDIAAFIAVAANKPGKHTVTLGVQSLSPDLYPYLVNLTNSPPLQTPPPSPEVSLYLLVYTHPINRNER